MAARVVPLPTAELQRAAGLMFGAALVLPVLPGHPGLPCPLRTLTGVPCPFCGMTTSVEATMHLDFSKAAAATPAGVALVVVALWFLVRRPSQLRYSMPLVWVGLALMWLFQLHRFGFL
jgi:hypothetical protein